MKYFCLFALASLLLTNYAYGQSNQAYGQFEQGTLSPLTENSLVNESIQPYIESTRISTERPELVDKTLVLRGQISSFDFTQPETRILIDTDFEQWELIAPSAVELRRLGWTSSSLFSGELVEVEVLRQFGALKQARLIRLTRANGGLLLTSINEPEQGDFGDIPGGMYALDTTHANLAAIYDHIGFSSQNVRFERVNANVLWNAATPEASIIQLNIDVSSLRSGVAKLDDALRGEEFFDFLNYPKIQFRSTQLRLLKWGDLKVDGQLEIKGINQPVQLSAQLNKIGPNPLSQDMTVGIRLSGKIARSNWGLSVYLPLVEDEIEIVFEGEFILRAADIPSASFSSEYPSFEQPDSSAFKTDKASDNGFQLNQ